MFFQRCVLTIFLLLLQDKAHVRKGHLDDSLQAHQYLADVAEAESWLKEKEPIVTSDDYGKDEDSAQVNIFVVFLSVSGLSFVPDVWSEVYNTTFYWSLWTNCSPPPPKKKNLNFWHCVRLISSFLGHFDKLFFLANVKFRFISKILNFCLWSQLTEYLVLNYLTIEMLLLLMGS